MNKLTASVSKRFTLSYKIAVNEKVIFVGLIVFTPFFVIYFLNQPDFFVRAARAQFKIPFIFLIFEYIFLLFLLLLFSAGCIVFLFFHNDPVLFPFTGLLWMQVHLLQDPESFHSNQTGMSSTHLHALYVCFCVCVCTLILNIHVCVSASVLRLTASGRESALEVVGTTRIHTNTTRSIRSTWSARDRCSLSSEDPGEDDNNKNI